MLGWLIVAAVAAEPIPDVVRELGDGTRVNWTRLRLELVEGARDPSVGQDARPLEQRSIRAVEARLPAGNFLRVHRSVIVNTTHIRAAQPFDQGDQLLILRNGKRITTGRRKTIRFVLRRWRFSLRKSPPSTGRSPSTGTLSRVSL